MRDVQHLRELILGLAIVTPVACSTAPPAPEVPPQGPQEVASSQMPAEAKKTTPPAEAPPVDVPPRDMPAPPEVSPPSPEALTTEIARTRAKRVRDVARRMTRDERVRRARSTSRAHPGLTTSHGHKGSVVRQCLTFKQVKDIQKFFYEREYASWKEYRRQKKRGMKPNSKPWISPYRTTKPKKPSRRLKTCPASLTKSISRARCQTFSNTWTLKETKVSDAGTLCCYEQPVQRPRRPCGRLYIVASEATQASLAEASSWMGERVHTPSWVSLELAARAGHAWLEDALEEHASIAAFSRATLELMALGAPANLLAEYQAASLDEIRHARRCFSLASALLDRKISAGPLEVEGPRDDLDAIILDVFWGGCVGESVAALCAQRALAGCDWAPAREALLEISEDEARHAALAWSTLSFLGQVAPERVRALLSGVVSPDAEVAQAPEAPGWARLGRLSPAQDARAAADAWAHLIAPMLRSVLA